MYFSGFYRVNYDLPTWRRLRNMFFGSERSSSKHRNVRAQLLDDALSLAKVGALDYEFALGMTT